MARWLFKWFVIVSIGFYVVTQPTNAANAVKNIAGHVTDAASGFGTFLASLS
jgi:hypothetical protein